MVSTTATAIPDEYRSTDKLIFGIVLAVITFRLFAQATLNVVPTMREELRVSESLTNIKEPSLSGRLLSSASSSSAIKKRTH